MLLLWRISSRK